MHDLVLSVVVFAPKIWRHYLYGKKLLFYTNHKILKYLLNQKELNFRQHHWIELLKDNVIADALSKKATVELWAMFAQLTISSDGSLLAKLKIKPVLFEQIREVQLYRKL